MSYLAKNNAYSTLASGISSGATSLTLQAGHGDRFPVLTAPDWTKITVEDSAGNREVMKVEARTAGSDVLATLTRGQEGTTARAWNVGDVVELRMTADLVEQAMAHWADTNDAHDASAISFSPSGGFSSTDVQAAIEEVAGDLSAHVTNYGTLASLSNKATARSNLGIEAAEVDVASAATTDIGAAASMNVRITGTTGITSLGTVAAGTVRHVRMAGALTLTHHATNLILPGGANIVTAAGDCFEALSLGSGNWHVKNYQAAVGFSERHLTISTSAPSGGNDGDIWFEREA